MLKKFSSEIFQKMYSFFSPELQLITVLPFFRNSYTSWSTSFIPLKLCVGFSIVDSVSFFQQKAWTLWLLNIILPFKIKTIEKPHTLLLPNLWFLSCNKKFESSKLWVGHIFSIVTVEEIFDIPLLRARLHETRSELKAVWNIKPFWNVVQFTWQFTWTLQCSNFPNNSKTLLHMCKWYLLIHANLIIAKQRLCYWLLFKQ